MSTRNTKIPRVEVRLQEQEKYTVDDIMDFIKSMLFEPCTEANKAIVESKKTELIYNLRMNFLDTLFNHILESSKTNLEWNAIKDIINLLQSLDNIVNEIEKHDMDLEYHKRRIDENLINKMQNFSESWHNRYEKLQSEKEAFKA